MVKLDAEMIRKFYLVSQKYVYVVKGLRLLESDQDKFPRSPCRPGYIDGVRTPEGRARFIRIEGSCPSDSIRLPSDGTEDVILAALQSEAGPNSDDIRDIAAWEFTEANGGVCSTSLNAVGASVDLDGDCWTQAHPHEQNVYDCTLWVTKHGGNDVAEGLGHRNPIAKWAMNGIHVLQFPSWHAQGNFEPDSDSELSLCLSVCLSLRPQDLFSCSFSSHSPQSCRVQINYFHTVSLSLSLTLIYCRSLGLGQPFLGPGQFQTHGEIW